MDSDPDERSAYIIGLAKNAQQVIRYSLYGQTINFLCDKKLTPEVKLHLGLTGDNARKSFMDMYVLTFIMILNILFISFILVSTMQLSIPVSTFWSTAYS
jgi:hypothetical protein